MWNTAPMNGCNLYVWCTYLTRSGLACAQTGTAEMAHAKALFKKFQAKIKNRQKVQICKHFFLPVSQAFASGSLYEMSSPTDYEIRFGFPYLCVHVCVSRKQWTWECQIAHWLLYLYSIHMSQAFAISYPALRHKIRSQTGCLHTSCHRKKDWY